MTCCYKLKEALTVFTVETGQLYPELYLSGPLDSVLRFIIDKALSAATSPPSLESENLLP